MNNPVSASRIHFLDTGRAIAALLVIVEHFCTLFFPQYAIWADNHFSIGATGVVLFFLISGYIIPLTWKKYNSLAGFWTARILRIFPLLWVCLTAALVENFVLGEAKSFSIPELIGNYSLLSYFVSSHHAILSVTWSLSLEFVLYAIISVVYLLKLENRIMAVIATGTTLFVALSAIFYMTLSKMPPVGVFAQLTLGLFGWAFLNSQRGNSVKGRTIAVASVIFFPILFGLLYVKYNVLGAMGGGLNLTAVPATISWGIALLLFAVLVKTNFTTPILQFLGEISYSMYLIHIILLLTLKHLNLSPVAVACVYFPGIILISWLTCKFIEIPSQEIGKKLGLAVAAKLQKK